MDIYQALKSDHDQLKPLLDQLVAASENDDSTKALLDQIRDLLIPHARAEETVFYNPLREIDTTKDMIGEAYAEHSKAEGTLRMLRGLEKINIEWTKAAESLRDDLNHHIAEEEGKIFAAARQVLFDEETQQMARAFEHLKGEAKEKGDLKNMMDMVANMMPKRFADKMRTSAPQ